LDIVSRASELFDEVVVAVLVNRQKSGLLPIPERLELLQAVTADLPNVRVDSFHGLLVDFCVANDVSTIVKGLRAVSDFDYELQMAQMNRRLADVDTVFMSTNPLYSFLSSSLVKDVATNGGDVAGLVPDLVVQALASRIRQRDGG